MSELEMAFLADFDWRTEVLVDENFAVCAPDKGYQVTAIDLD